MVDRFPLPRRLVLARAAGAVLAAVAGPALASRLPRMQVWKDPGCGCCKDWIAILEKEGFEIEAFDAGNVAARKRLGLPERLGSCHTGLIGGYVVEGHVPPSDIRRLLAEKPAALGLAVPGMPIGSPGMDGPVYKGRKDPYDVLLVARDGSTRVWSRYR